MHFFTGYTTLMSSRLLHLMRVNATDRPGSCAQAQQPQRVLLDLDELQRPVRLVDRSSGVVELLLGLPLRVLSVSDLICSGSSSSDRLWR